MAAINDFLEGKYEGLVAFKMTQAPCQNQFIGTDFAPTLVETWWRIVKAEYNDSRGYWIFRNDLGCQWTGPLGTPPQPPPAGNKCQCWSRADFHSPVELVAKPLLYWNTDGQAAGNPELNEMFGVYLLPGPTVIIQSLLADGAYVFYDIGEVYLQPSPTLHIDQDASIRFEVIFPTEARSSDGRHYEKHHP